MFPNLSYISNYFFGTPVDNFLSIIQTFGLFLLLAFITAGYVLKRELVRMRKMGFFNGRKLAIDGKEELIYPEHKVVEIATVAAIFGILGSKVFSIFENWEAFMQNPIRVFFSGSGLTIYGGLIVAFIACYIYTKRLKIPPLRLMDAAVPALLVGYIVGRLGCHFSGDGDWGKINLADKPSWFVFPDWAWAYDYPHNVVNSLVTGMKMPNCGGLIAVGGAEPKYCTILKDAVFPTPIYEVVLCSIILIFLWSIRKRIKWPGVLFFIYLFLNGIERFFIEFIRVNERYEFLGLGWSFSQWIAFIFILLSPVGIYLLGRKKA